MINVNIDRFFHGWRIVRQIGAGGFGKVYEIERDRFGKIEKAALKVMNIPGDTSVIADMRDEGYDDESIRRRLKADLDSFASEYDHMREVKHTNIVSCDDIEYEENKDDLGYTVYLKMELLTPLTESLKKGFDREKTAIALAKDICRALELCEKRKIVHRDIKPQNLFVNAHGEYKLGDFGIARKMDHATNATKTGTYKYMAPEVYNNKAYDNSVDIYSLGLVMYWQLNDMRMPFLPLPPTVPTSQDEEMAKFRRLNGARIPEPRYGSEGLKKIVLKACEADRTKRYKSAADMLADLESLDKEKTSGAGTSKKVDGEYRFSYVKNQSDKDENSRGNSWDDDDLSFDSKSNRGNAAKAKGNPHVNSTPGVAFSTQSVGNNKGTRTDSANGARAQGKVDGEYRYSYVNKQSDSDECTRGNSWDDDDVTFDTKSKRGNSTKAKSNPYVNSTPGAASSGKSSGYSKSSRAQSANSDDKTEAARNYGGAASIPYTPESEPNAFSEENSMLKFLQENIPVPRYSLSVTVRWFIILGSAVAAVLTIPFGGFLPIILWDIIILCYALKHAVLKSKTKIVRDGNMIHIYLANTKSTSWFDNNNTYAVALNDKWIKADINPYASNVVSFSVSDNSCKVTLATVTSNRKTTYKVKFFKKKSFSSSAK